MNLWNTRVFGVKNRELTKTNLYNKEIELGEQGDGTITSIKSDVIASTVQKANVFEVIVVKYLAIALFTWLLFNISLYYVSMAGLFLGIFAYLGFFTLKKKVSTFFAYFFLLVLFAVYIVGMFLFPQETLKYKFNWIVNYSIQYFLWIYLFEKVAIDIFTYDFTKWYKIDKLTLTYFKINDENEGRVFEKKSLIIKKIYTIVLAVLMILSFLFGAGDLVGKINLDNAVESRILSENNNEMAVIKNKNARALKAMLEKKSQELKIIAHTKKDMDLLMDDFDKYVQTGVISYEKLRIDSSNKFVDANNGKPVTIIFNKPYYVVKTWVKKYKDGIYRWHFANNKKIFVVINEKAR